VSGRPTVAITSWGDLFEDFFDTLGMGVDQFRTQMTGGWLFGYVEALDRVGVDCLLVFVSARVRRPLRFRHTATGARVSILPAPRRHGWVRGVRSRLGRSGVPGYKALGSVASYGSVPVVAFLRELRLSRADVILSQDYEHARFDLFVLLGRLTGRPVFGSFQGGVAPFSRLERPLRGRTVRASAGLIVGAGEERARLQEVYGVDPRRIANVPNGLDVERYRGIDRAEARRQLGISPSARVVEWHGRVSIQRKGLDVLLAAWALVCRVRPGADLVLLLVGTGDDALDLHRLIETSGLDSIRWHDEYINDRAKLAVYPSAADIYVLPSRHEGFPVAPVEAMAGGLPVVACDAPGVSDILAGGEQAGGLVVPRDDPASLAEALGRLIDDPALTEQLGRAARRTADERFSLDAVGRRLREVLLGDATS
jgi:glycosyltransferase involved in cell wall biosynthesis